MGLWGVGLSVVGLSFDGQRTPDSGNKLMSSAPCAIRSGSLTCGMISSKLQKRQDVESRQKAAVQCHTARNGTKISNHNSM